MACIFHVIGKKDVGKTSVIEKVVKEVKKYGLKVAVIKHSHHKLDLSGKDTDRYRNSGSDYIIFQEGEYESVLFMPNVSSLSLINVLPADVVIIEGFSNIEIGKKYVINSVDEIENLSKQILNDVKNECKKEIRNLKLNGITTAITSDHPLLLTLYNLMTILGLRDVSSD
ncbi:molybdopterin-guanine dinucleotide biosynthesis protein B [Sulfolobus tengchongensis]|uniref:Molybdopterin-guanine dinucleotide biosynthesis protein B n=1 Tax=Sulfolobus tengchongensis TaxID=207809 RepID=A0AAX4KZM0_9CREN